MTTLYLAEPCPDCNTSADTAAELHALAREVASVRLIDGPGPSLTVASERVVAAMARMGKRIACARNHGVEATP